MEKLLSPQELASYLDVSVPTLYGWRYRGDGPAGFRIGGHLRYRSNDVEEWIEEQLRQSNPLRYDQS